MPQSRVLFYLALLGLLPILFALYRYQSDHTCLANLERQLDAVQEQVYLLQKKQAANNRARHYYAGADPFYIAKQVSSLPLLEEERQALEKSYRAPDLAPDPLVSRRLEELKNNVLDFSEGAVQVYPLFREIPMTQSRPVEVDKRDLAQILSRLEGVEIGEAKPGANRPQTLITDFKIDRKTTFNGSQLYTLSLKLVKREYP